MEENLKIKEKWIIPDIQVLDINLTQSGATQGTETVDNFTFNSMV